MKGKYISKEWEEMLITMTKGMHGRRQARVRLRANRRKTLLLGCEKEMNGRGKKGK